MFFFLSQRTITPSTVAYILFNSTHLSLLFFFCFCYDAEYDEKLFYTIYRKASERPDDWCITFITFNSCYNFIYRIRLRVTECSRMHFRRSLDMHYYFFLFCFNLGETLLLEMMSHVLVYRGFGFVGCAFLVLLLSRGWVFFCFLFKEPPLW